MHIENVLRNFMSRVNVELHTKTILAFRKIKYIFKFWKNGPMFSDIFVKE